MTTWPKHPIIYEINSWVWLQELGRRHHAPISLATIPEEEWDALARLNVDAVWFMGVWERSPAGIAISMNNPGLLADFRRALPDFVETDNVGSPYCVRRYVVDDHLGGPEGLAVARQELALRGMRLILDLVPNHMAPDHLWVTGYPEHFIQGSADNAKRDPASFTTLAGRVYACGRDPYFPAWPDVLQLNAFNAGLRTAIIETVSSIADQCDGILRLHLCANLAYQERLIRFIENHDEPRAAETFSPEKARAAAVTVTTLPEGHYCFMKGSSRGVQSGSPYFWAAVPMNRRTLLSRHSTPTFCMSSRRKESEKASGVSASGKGGLTTAVSSTLWPGAGRMNPGGNSWSSTFRTSGLRGGSVSPGSRSTRLRGALPTFSPGRSTILASGRTKFSK